MTLAGLPIVVSPLVPRDTVLVTNFAGRRTVVVGSIDLFLVRVWASQARNEARDHLAALVTDLERKWFGDHE